jgi:SET domain-containing protein
MEAAADGPGRECWLDPRLEIRASPIEGRGLVANEPITVGEAVERLGGILVTDDELGRMLESATSYVDSVSVYDGVNLLLPAGSPVHFGNHSCEPTLWWVDPFTLVARIEIGAGGEVTVDYGTLTDDPDFRMECNCGAELCRGEVTGCDWQRHDLQQRYGDHWVPVLRRRIASG